MCYDGILLLFSRWNLESVQIFIKYEDILLLYTSLFQHVLYWMLSNLIEGFHFTWTYVMEISLFLSDSPSLTNRFYMVSNGTVIYPECGCWICLIVTVRIEIDIYRAVAKIPSCSSSGPASARPWQPFLPGNSVLQARVAPCGVTFNIRCLAFTQHLQHWTIPDKARFEPSLVFFFLRT